ncbi:MAG: Rieske 2Fe-2S domain-containing protein [Chloroflexota bacterium]
MSWKRLCAIEDVPEEDPREFEVEGDLKVLVLNTGTGYFAYQASCPHMDTPLAEGILEGTTLTCHQHLWQWNAETGEAKGLAEMPLRRYETKEEDGYLYVLAD